MSYWWKNVNWKSLEILENNEDLPAPKAEGCADPNAEGLAWPKAEVLVAPKPAFFFWGKCWIFDINTIYQMIYLLVAGAAPNADCWAGCPKALVAAGVAPKALGVDVAPNPKYFCCYGNRISTVKFF